MTPLTWGNLHTLYRLGWPKTGELVFIPRPERPKTVDSEPKDSEAP